MTNKGFHTHFNVSLPRPLISKATTHQNVIKLAKSKVLHFFRINTNFVL